MRFLMHGDRAPRGMGSGLMDEEEIAAVLKAYPGARRAAQGVIFDLPEGSFYSTGFIRADPELTTDELLHTGFCSKNEILRMRDLRTPHDYMLRVRAQAIQDSTRVQRAFRQRRNLFEKAGGRWSLTDYYARQNGDAKRYVARLKRPHQRQIKAIPYGLAPLGEANAVAMRSLVGDVVLVSENLRYFYYFMNIAMYGAYHDIDQGNRVDAALIALRIMRGSESFDFDLDPRATFPAYLEREFQEMTGRQIEFTFGHEFAHYLEGHLVEPSPGTDVRTYAFACEFTADRQAVLFAASDKASRARLRLGAYDVLLYLHFLEVAAARGLMPSFAVSMTHPPALERIHALCEDVSNRGGSDRAHLDLCVEAIERTVGFAEERIASSERPDLLTFYGSLYLPSYTKRILKDRLEF